MHVITSDSFCPIQYKQAVFHSMAHRLCTLPLSVENYKREYDYIKSVADANGYSEKMVDDIIKNHANKVKRKSMSTFFSHPNSDKEKKRLSMCYAPIITNKLKPIFT